MLDQFSATVEKIYAAAGDNTSWPDALAAVEQLTGSAGAVVHIVPKRPTEQLISLLGHSAEGYFSPENVEEWTRDYAPMCPRLAAPIRLPGAPYYVDYMLLSERELDLDPVYEWYGSHGLRYFIGSKLLEDDDAEVVWSLQRRRNQGHAQQEDVDLFQLLEPHLRRSLCLSRQLGTMHSLRSLGSALLEAIPQAIFALDRNGRVLVTNDAAAQLMRCSDGGLRLIDGQLLASNDREQRELNYLIGTAGELNVGAAGGWTKLSRPNDMTSYAVLVAPVRSPEPIPGLGEVKVLVIVHDPSRRPAADPAVLTSLYALTETEARLASAISVGHSVQSAAACLSMQVATARSHLKSIFLKLGVSRQQDLVSLVTSLRSVGT